MCNKIKLVLLFCYNKPVRVTPGHLGGRVVKNVKKGLKHDRVLTVLDALNHVKKLDHVMEEHVVIMSTRLYINIKVNYFIGKGKI